MHSAVGSTWEVYLIKTIYLPHQHWVKVKEQQELRAGKTYPFNGQEANITEKRTCFLLLTEDKVYQLGKHV